MCANLFIWAQTANKNSTPDSLSVEQLDDLAGRWYAELDNLQSAQMAARLSHQPAPKTTVADINAKYIPEEKAVMKVAYRIQQMRLYATIQSQQDKGMSDILAKGVVGTASCEEVRRMVRYMKGISAK